MQYQNVCNHGGGIIKTLVITGAHHVIYYQYKATDATQFTDTCDSKHQGGNKAQEVRSAVLNRMKLLMPRCVEINNAVLLHLTAA